MFKKNNPSGMSKTAESASSTKVNTIVDGTRIEGSIQSEGNFRIDGYLKGDVSLKGKLIIGPSGQVEGQVSCQNAEIEGSFRGVIQVKELLYLKASAKIFGDSIFSKLRVEEGAKLECTCNYNAADASANGAVIKDFTQREPESTAEARRQKEERTA